jgi:1,4-alpha-glucan branching enzyme
VLWPIDRHTIALVWSDAGYPSAGVYRDYHELTEHHHRVLGNDGQPYDHERAVALAREHAQDFVARVLHRVADGGVCVCALDTELLGHWWYEGVHWLNAVVEQAARQGLTLTTLDDALERHDVRTGVPELPEVAISWGKGGGLETWSGPAVADLAWQARTAELRALARGSKPSERALRELLALQSSDWAFQRTHEQAGHYPVDRVERHAAELHAALDSTRREPEPGVRNLQPHLDLAPLVLP